MHNIDNFSIIAKAIEFEKDQWIKATLYANNEMYEFKKQLNVAKLDDIKIGCLGHWKDSQTNTWKYAFIIEMVPNYPFEYFDYCWDDDVAKITAEGDTITGKYIFIQNAKFFQKGLADIESDGGDVGETLLRAIVVVETVVTGQTIRCSQFQLVDVVLYGAHELLF